MVRENRKTIAERPTNASDNAESPNLRNYRIPRLSRPNTSDVQESAPPSNQSRNRRDSPNRDTDRQVHSHHDHSSSDSSRRHRESANERSRHRANLHERLGPPREQRRSPIRYPADNRYRRSIDRRHSIERHQPPRRQSIAQPLARSSGSNPIDPQLVRVIQPCNTQVLKFPDVPVEVSLVEFLHGLSRWMRGVTGASREFNYENGSAGNAIFIYAVVQDEIDAAIDRPFSFAFTSGIVSIKPILLSCVITSIVAADVTDPSIKTVPTIMLRNLIPITTRHAIAAAIDAAETVAQVDAIVTHVRVPAKDLGLAKTAAIAFVGVSTSSRVTELDGFVSERLAKRVTFARSFQAPVLIPKGMANQPHDKEWSTRAARINMLIRRNPFEQDGSH